MRHIILDTETTGLSPHHGHRIIEIGCIETVNFTSTGRTYHQYINPERDVPADAFAVHGISSSFLRDKPTFKEVVNDFLKFLGEDYKLVIHNAGFDMNFINYELGSLKLPAISNEYVIDTLAMARKAFPGAKNSLDALCSRFSIDNSHRELHGALLDAEILSRVYVHLNGGPQAGFNFGHQEQATVQLNKKKQQRPRREYEPTKQELEAHKKFVSEIENPLWLCEE